ncbi:hypothetical protein [Arenibacter certesii]|uniref:Lipoprotein n=1 Tax=Arenibacter certesii TaxID=228955 RepID=A0A918ILN1_9FLAO|nr:hypothetical protein [Arenibacter certesii]GGW21930.1 hypothetical protein GCM10007383_00930 [Arenibacter certesii]
MTKCLTYFSLLFLFTSCAFISEKFKGTTDSLIEVDALDHFENSTIIIGDPELESEEAEVDFQQYEDQYAEPNNTEGIKEIHFTELWIWEYLSEDREWKEMWVFREPNLNYWLFERLSSFGVSSEMCEWVLAKPNGEYIFNYQEPEMNTPNTIDRQVIDFVDEKEFSYFWKPRGEIKNFGDSVHGWEVFKGEKYEVFFKGQPDPSVFYVGTSDIDMRPLHHFNNLEGDIELPISFPIGIPKNTMVLSEETDFAYYNMKVNYRFKHISSNSYYVYLPEDYFE